MNDELVTEGYGADVQFVTINGKGAASSVTGLTSNCDFPVFQDTSAVNAWTQHGGKKDDMYIYDKQGNLALFLPITYSGPTSTNLGTPGGYSHVKNAVLDALNAP
jgi:hypothetical protein